MTQRFGQGLGVQANAWSNATTGANTNSNSLDIWGNPFVSAFGHVSGATTITLMYSQDNTNWYAGPTVVLAGAADFKIDATTGARYVALQSTNSVTATATLTAK